MNIIQFENMLKFDLDWHVDEFTEEEYDFICETASYMSDRDRSFFYSIIKKMMRREYD
jgi:hypothetical protein